MLKTAYPAIIKKNTDDTYTVSIPQFKHEYTKTAQAEAIQAAREGICRHIALCEDTEEGVPLPAAIPEADGTAPQAQVILIDIDMAEYRLRTVSKAVRKNCTIPQWLDTAARKKGINFSQTLQKAILQQLGME